MNNDIFNEQNYDNAPIGFNDCIFDDLMSDDEDADEDE